MNQRTIGFTSSSAARVSRHRRALSGATFVVLSILALHPASADGPQKVGDESRAVAAPAKPIPFGTFEHLFAADSPWNSRPVDPVLGDTVIPKSQYVAAISAGEWSTGVFLAKASDPPMTVHGAPGTQGVWDPDSELMREVTLPHWPAALLAAPAADGHAEIVDATTGILHSFWQLKKIDGRWTASLYAWSRVDGRGWSDPAHYYQGARATAVPSSGGLIRTSEIDDGDTMFRHALGASMTFNGLSADPTYVFPATSADAGADKSNTGKIPEGALLMLPPDFDVQKLTTPELRKVAETLKVFGAYVVDRNVGVPFVINAEMGSGFDPHKGGWNYLAGLELDAIRMAVRPVVSAKGWLDGNGKSYTPLTNLNLLSMRGPWTTASDQPNGLYDTWRQAVVFPASTTRARQTNASGHGLHEVAWAKPKAGERYRIKAIATGGATLRLTFRNASGGVVFDSGDLSDGATSTFAWPGDATPVVDVASGIGGPSSIAGELRRVSP